MRGLSLVSPIDAGRATTRLGREIRIVMTQDSAKPWSGTHYSLAGQGYSRPHCQDLKGRDHDHKNEGHRLLGRAVS